jgi:hypothetical protein
LSTIWREGKTLSFGFCNPIIPSGFIPIPDFNSF